MECGGNVGSLVVVDSLAVSGLFSRPAGFNFFLLTDAVVSDNFLGDFLLKYRQVCERIIAVGAAVFKSRS